ncbi:hypothetical protein, no similarity [Geotrichum candidum]|uniref:Uncharacterized protein n=1 Tax=Geotrichum candidum TaxID=1173061 RepID=A0A0J9XEJ0_GEOCN|nr:hypothetical protein, no similarity [Geotrichum candidum]
MIPTRVLMSAAKPKASWKDNVPVETYPLFAAMGFALFAAGYTVFGKFSRDTTLRLSRQGKPAPADH